MSYILQSIAFLLALMGILFKSTKTDSEGKPIYTSYGLPSLTKTGVVVLVLIAVSFLFSILNSWQQSLAEAKRKSDSEVQQQQLTSDLNDVKQRNEGLKDGIKEIIRASTSLSEEQKKSFESVYLKQKETGDEIAGNIRESADILRSRVDSSIDLLNLSGQEIVRAVNPLTNLRFSFLINFPSHRLLTAYQHRLDNTHQQFINSLYAWPPELFSVEGSELGTGGMSFDARSPLFPNSASERTVYYALREITINIRILKKPTSAPFGANVKPDMEFRVFADSDSRDADQTRSTKMRVQYHSNNGFGVYSNNVALNQFVVTNRGTIVSFPDLRGAQMVISFGSVWVSDADNDSLQEIQRGRELKGIRIATADGRGLSLRTERMPHDGFNGYIFTFPPTTKEVFNLMN